MSYREKSERERAGIPKNPTYAATAMAVISGAVAGAIIGFFMVAGSIGALVGGIVGAVAAVAIERLAGRRERRRSSKDAILDREIGVIGGDIGASPSGVPPPLREAPAAGPFPR